MRHQQFSYYFIQLLKRGGHLLGLDADTLATLVFRGWSIIAGAVLIFFIPYWLDQIEQGYYYTFASLIALQIFFELGMNQVIVQRVSHDFAHLQLIRGDKLNGPSDRLDRLSSLVGLLRRWYLVAAAVFALSVSAGGAFFLSQNGSLPYNRWMGPWVVLVLATAANLYLSSKLAVREGCGEIKNVARIRFIQSLVGHCIMWIFLSLGFGLWSTPVVPIIAAVVTAHWLSLQENLIGQLQKKSSKKTNNLRWIHDIFPFQWRIALSWISGYFIFQILTPLAFSRQGAIEAGRLGITLAIFNSLLTIGMSWVNAKAPVMAAQISRGEHSNVNHLFRQITWRASLFTAALAIAALAILVILETVAPTVARRFTSLPVSICIAVVTVTNTFIFSAATYMRAHGEEPMIWVSLVSAFATLLVTLEGSTQGLFPMIFMYMLVTVSVSLPWTYLIFRRYYHNNS